MDRRCGRQVDEISTGGQKYLPLTDGSFLAQGYAPTKHTVEMTVKTDVQNITAFRLELLNDPNLPLGGPGRSIKGTAALTEFEVEAAPADNSGKVDAVKFVKATADVNPPETPLEAIFDDKSGKKRVTGPVEIRHRRQGRHGVGHRHRSRPAQSAAQGRLHRREADRPSQGHDPDIPPDAEPRRLEQRRQPEPQPGPLPPVDHDAARRRGRPAARGACATSWPCRATAARRPRRRAVFSYWRTTVAEWKDANDRIEALWKKHPEGSSQLVLQPRRQPRDTHVLKRGDFLKPAQTRDAGRAGVPASAAGRRAARIA